MNSNSIGSKCFCNCKTQSQYNVDNHYKLVRHDQYNNVNTISWIISSLTTRATEVIYSFLRPLSELPTEPVQLDSHYWLLNTSHLLKNWMNN